MPSTSLYSRITGTGSYLPPRRLSNEDIAAELAAKGVETSSQWIIERTGIHSRHFAAPDVNCSDLALEAAKNALAAAGLQAGDIDLIIVATSTPDMVFPSSACILQNKLGIAGCPAFDMQAVCSGFVYALTVADAMIKSGSATKALVVGDDVNDEMAFEKAPAGSVTVRIGPSQVPTLARFRLSSQDRVNRLLSILLALRH